VDAFNFRGADFRRALAGTSTYVLKPGSPRGAESRASS